MYFSPLFSKEANLHKLNETETEEVYIELNDLELYVYDEKKQYKEIYYKIDEENELFENTNFTSAGEMLKIIW